MRKGFTLLELLIVVCIIAILAGVGLPTMLNVTKKAKLSEGLLVLGTYREAQFRYAMFNNNYTANCCKKLDVDFTMLKYFSKAKCYAVPIEKEKETIVSIKGKRGLKAQLSINIRGDITCTGKDCTANLQNDKRSQRR